MMKRYVSEIFLFFITKIRKITSAKECVLKGEEKLDSLRVRCAAKLLVLNTRT